MTTRPSSISYLFFDNQLVTTIVNHSATQNQSTHIMKLRHKLFGVLAAFTVAASFQIQSAAFMKLGDIKGEATDNAHKEWIDVLSVSSSVNRPMDSSTGRLGPATPGPLTCRKRIDKSSPLLARALVTNEVIPLVEIELTRAYGSSGSREVYYRYELKNVQITSYNVSGAGSAEDVPTEDFSLNYEEIKWTYTERDNDSGSEKGKVEASWKVEEGEA